MSDKVDGRGQREILDEQGYFDNGEVPSRPNLCTVRQRI